MKELTSFFEIPAIDFDRAIVFYEAVFNVSLIVRDWCETEKMAFFPGANGQHAGAISWLAGAKPGQNKALISLRVDDMDSALQQITAYGGMVTCGKITIEAENVKYFSIFTDSEGNSVGLYSGR